MRNKKCYMYIYNVSLYKIHVEEREETNKILYINYNQNIFHLIHRKKNPLNALIL